MMGSPHKAPTLPPLPLEEWEATKETLHRYCQIVGKVRMEYSPYRPALHKNYKRLQEVVFCSEQNYHL